MKQSSDYWQKRFQAIEDSTHDKSASEIKKVDKMFTQAQKEIDSEIAVWYQRFADNNQITMADARKMLTSSQLKELHWDINDYIKYGVQNDLDQQWIKELENASAKFHISRLEALKIHTQQSVEKCYADYNKTATSLFGDIYQSNYYLSAFEIQKGFNVGFDVGQINEKQLNNILSKPWTADNNTFSKRIWGSRTKLVNELHNQLTQNCILGKSPNDSIKTIAQKFNVSRNQASRLIMTESAYFGSAAQKDCFNTLDVEQYEVVATLDSRTSAICQDLDGQVFDMKDFQAGVTAPPFHVWCRSVTAPYFEDDYGERAARDAEGNTYYVPSSMKYADWKDSFVDGGSKVDLKPLKEIVNKNGENVSFVLNSLSSEKQETVKTTISNLMDKYNSPLKEVLYEKADFTKTNVHGAVDSYYGMTMRLHSVEEQLITHEFAHTFDSFKRKKYGNEFETNTEFVSEIQKLFTKYKKEAKENPLLKISEYSFTNQDEFMAEGFSMALTGKSMDVPGEKANIYANEVLKIIDKYYKKDELKEIGKGVTIKSEIRKALEETNIEHKEVITHKTQPSVEEIINRLGGGDQTEGSCSSLAFAYMGNRNGYDVLDFRGGASRKFFSTNSNIKKMLELPNVSGSITKVEKEIKGTMDILNNLDLDKEYYLAVGKHAAIVRNTENGVEYLELQSRLNNGWTSFDNKAYGSMFNTLFKRFGCRKTVDKLKVGSVSMIFEKDVVLMDVSSFSKNDEFSKILGYINTAVDKQKKGAMGDVK